jgi:hypothetical protein
MREGWDPKPPNVDPNGWFFSAQTIAELADKIVNPYQFQPVPARALEETVAKYNSHVGLGKDPDFRRPTPKYKIRTPPFHAAWSTPIVHDTLAGLKINPKCQVVDLHGRVIPGLVVRANRQADSLCTVCLESSCLAASLAEKLRW